MASIIRSQYNLFMIDLRSDTVTRPMRPLTEDEKQGIPAILDELGVTGSSGA